MEQHYMQENNIEMPSKFDDVSDQSMEKESPLPEFSD